MKSTFKSLILRLQKAWLRSQINMHARSLQTIAEQRENDFQAECILHREVTAMRSKLQSL
ncbi:hypothetical protein CR105_04090 [Massilia eurypsychrophila]|jgi:hypothetical protein|uniref:Uncharacterized protein n=1 Tax=Massilia eurypsychrophila TaxID=1485217 RepID=A0A2G8TJQ3_9BURK|nr:hypothetical protein [Massilia eurypsychrophila]PIL46276.1 hypothetical protein CR105_04090 [Massilia eurypsychrophila]